MIRRLTELVPDMAWPLVIAASIASALNEVRLGNRAGPPPTPAATFAVGEGPPSHRC
jgi:hypothetical protein